MRRLRTNKRRLARWTVLCASLLFGFLAGSAHAGGTNPSSVVATKHDLSILGRGSVKSTEPEACVFCHTPHITVASEKPLWNHRLATKVYTTYTSSTFGNQTEIPVQEPEAGVSKLCLSCHDGSVALGMTASRGPIPTTGSMRAEINLGDRLTNDHPVGFQPVDDGQLASELFQTPAVSKDSKVTLPNGRVECTSCHNPHDPAVDTFQQKFLVRSNSNGDLCLACHEPSRPAPNALNGWTASIHAKSTVTVPTAGLFPPYGALGTNACSSCHRSHSMPAAAGPRLLRVPEESACTLCHSSGSGVSAPDVEAEFNKPYAHPTLTVSGAHDPAEAAFPLNDPPTTRHAECADCHQPHATLQGPGSQNPPDVEPALTGASGYNGTTPLRPAVREYEVCFKCHANSTNKPQNNPGFAVFGRTPVRRADALAADAHDLLEKFSSATARHNVTQARRLLASQLPSLRTFILNPNGSQGRSLAAGTFIYCTDCHSSDQAPRTGGSGTDGPHGSLYPHILTRRYDAEALPVTAGASSAGVPYVPGSNGTAGLCDKCHDIEGSILHNDSFKEHDKHVRGEGASCSTCHDPHGVGAAPAANHSSLVNFDISIVAPSSSGLLRFERTGTFSGRCYLTCHGQNHNPEGY